MGSAAAGVSPVQLPPALPLPLLSQAKFFCAIQGELNCCNSMGALEMHQRLEQLKRSIHRVHLYSQGEAQPLPGSSNPVNLTRPRVPGPKVFIMKMNIHKTRDCIEHLSTRYQASAISLILPCLFHSLPPFLFLSILRETLATTLFLNTLECFLIKKKFLT